MAKQTTTNREKLKQLYIHYGLCREDIFTHDKFGYVMVTRTGVEKLMAHDNINVKYETVNSERKWAVVKAIATMGEIVLETYGSANEDNCRISYYAEMAEKRAKARSVLQLCGLYSIGVYSEVESDEFNRNNSKTKPDDPKLGDVVNEMNSKTTEEIGDKMLNTMREYNGE